MREAEVLRRLGERAQTLAVAESLTGGLLAETLVRVPGASRVFRGGLVVYATDLKASLAGVPEELLARRGPVDPDVAVALAEGARDRCRASWGLATTGVAGPDPQNGVPVGTVYVAAAGPRATTVRTGGGGEGAGVDAGPAEAGGGSASGAGGAVVEVRRLVLAGDRAAIRQGAVEAALDLLLSMLA